MRIEATPRERKAREFDEGKLKAVVKAIHVDGYVVLGAVIDPVALTALRSKLVEDTAELLRRMDRYDAGPFTAHLSQAMPPCKEHIHADVVANPFVIQVTSRILGEGVHNHFYNCNTNMPGSQSQTLHRDAPHLEGDWLEPMTSIVVNVSLMDVNEVNGATEVWPGTHRIPGSTRVTEDAEAQRHAVFPPVQVVCSKGDAVLRDPRMWHRGTPNNGTEPRHMIAMVHSRSIYMRETAIPVTGGAVQSFSDDVLTTRVTLVPDDYDYLATCVRG